MKNGLKTILETGKAPGMRLNTPDERSPEGAVPCALKQLSNGDVRKMTRESGFSVDHFKRTWNV